MVNAPADWYAGQEVDAETMEAEIHDQFADLVAPWTSYTPTWTATGTAPALLNGTLTGRYKLIGKTCIVSVKLTAGSSTTYGTGSYMLSLPVAAVAGFDSVGQVFIGDSSVGAAGYSTTGVALVLGGGTTMGLYAGNTGSGSAVTPTNPQTFASGDRIWASIAYKTA
jgi:hypothetical protein